MCSIPDMPLWDVSCVPAVDKLHGPYTLGTWDKLGAASLLVVHRPFAGPHFLVARRRNHDLLETGTEPDPSEIGPWPSIRPRILDGSWFIWRERVRTLLNCSWTPMPR